MTRLKRECMNAMRLVVAAVRSEHGRDGAVRDAVYISYFVLR